MKQNYEELLKQALTPNEEPAFWLNQKILRKAEEEKRMKAKTYKKILATAASTALVLGIGSLSVTAAWKYLMPNQIAQEMSNEKLAEVFQSETAVLLNDIQHFGGYQITLLGIASGEQLYDSMDMTSETISIGRSYIVTAIENEDGTPMPEILEDAYDELEFLVTPLVKGYDPAEYNVFAFAGGYTDKVIDGILYRIMECDNIEIFADCGIYLAVTDTTFYQPDAYVYDETSGEITRNETYDGLNALFTLPMDTAKANPQAVQEYIEGLFAKSKNDAEVQPTASDIDVWVAQLTAENIEEFAVCVEQTVQILQVDEEGYLYTAPYEIEGRGGSNGGMLAETAYALEESEVGKINIIGYAHSETLETLSIETLTRNEDGSYTFAVYIPKE